MPSAPVPPPPTVVRPVEELILSGADVNVLNHTTLSLWHFRQLALQLLPPERAVEATDPAGPAKNPNSTAAAPEFNKEERRTMELGEGMNVAAILYEQAVDEETDPSAETSEDEVVGEAAATKLHSHEPSNNSSVSGSGLQLPATVHGQLTPTSRVAAVFKRYRCVICLDASPSTLSIDPSTGRLFLDLLYESVELFIWSLLRPMEVGDVAFAPELHVSVLVQGALVESLCVLLQGYIVTPSNAVGFLQLIKQRIQLIEDDWAAQAQESGDWGYLGNATPACLDWILQNAVFALHSLPTDGVPMLVLVTDGVVDLRNAYSYDNLLMQLVRHDIQCHFLRVGGSDDDEPNASFGFVPDSHLLRFIADSTGGAIFDYLAVHDACYGATSASSNRIRKMTSLQDACFVRKSSVHVISEPVIKLDEMDSTSFDGRTLLPLRPYRMWREKVHEYRIFADVDRIIEARLREGFVINKVHVKTFQQPIVVERPTARKDMELPRSGSGATATGAGAEGDGTDGRYREVTKILIVFLLQWKQNVWLEYVVSTTTDNSALVTASATTVPHGGRRTSGQGAKAPTPSSTTKKPAAIFSRDQSAAWSEWYVKMNILAYADFLRAFEDTMQRSSTSGGEGTTAQANRGEIPMGSPLFVHDFIRNVQDVDRVLLHLMTATASISDASESAGNQFSFGTSGNSSLVTSANPQPTSSHPVFNIIGELSTVLWHRWFFVERFEMLCVVKSDACMDLFYRTDAHTMIERGNPGSHMRGTGYSSQGLNYNHSANVYGTSVGTTAIGTESLAEPLVAALAKWSSLKLSQDLFLKFLSPATSDKSHTPPRAKVSSNSSMSSGGIVLRRRQRGHGNSMSGNGGEDNGVSENGSGSTTESKAALCFVRLEFKNKTLCAVHVAFFATGASVRRQVLHDLKSTIFAGINEVAVTPSPATLLASSSLTETPIILCHRMMSRLLVTHDTLLLHGIDEEPHPFDRYVVSPTLEAEKNAGAFPPASVCCGGSELQLQRVFGAYMWHSSWKWEVPNPSALLTVMRRLHEARISSGFWVLDWKMEEGEDGQGAHAESVIFGREILMEDEKGHTKTALVQYALRRVSETCLMTSFWMEPQHGVVKTRLSEEVDHTDRFHWSLKQAIGHNTPFEDQEGRGGRRGNQGSATRGEDNRSTATASSVSSSVEDELHFMEQEDVSIDWSGGSTYLGESDLLQLIRGYLFKSDRHFLSCLYTFDSVINLRESIELLSQLSKDVEGVIGSNWRMDRQLAAENGMILPPFSTARLLATSKRSTEHFLMYLESDKPTIEEKETAKSGSIAHAVSPANENLYSMLERTLRGLSDCEVSWTDYNGDVVGVPAAGSESSSPDGDRIFREGMDGQLPLWLKHHLALEFQDRVPHYALSKGKCFAKLVSDDCVVLAFFPSLDTLQVRHKRGGNAMAAKKADKGDDVVAQFEDKFKWSLKPKSGEEGDRKKPSQQFSALAAEENGTQSRVMRMSVSADDIVLYQERRRSFREGYKSWRMGHYQGSRDEKQSYGRDFQKLRLTSTPEDHEFCEELSRHTSYGCDFHLLIERANGALGSGFFQVAFYECSVSRLSTDLHDQSNQKLQRADLPQTILKRLFFSKRPAKAKEDRPPIPLDRSGLWKRSPTARSPANPMGSSYPRQVSDNGSIVASRRFRKKVKRAHEHNFSRGVYIALREGGTVQHSDLLQALSSCRDVPVDVDITLLYRMMEAAAASGRPALLSPSAAAVASTGVDVDILQAKLTKSFETILSNVFAPIPGTKYYYFTGNENTTYEDASEGEYDLHFLMEDSEEVESEARVESNDEDENQLEDGVTEEGEDPRLQFSRSAGEDAQAAARHQSSLGSTTINGQEPVTNEGEKPVSRASQRRGSFARDLPPPVITSSEDGSGSEQHRISVEEDAEFNKEVAVATSSFSVPFFFRFECRVLSNPRETQGTAADLQAPGTAPDLEPLHRPSSSASYVDLRKEMIAHNHAQAQIASPSDRQEEFNAFLASLKGNDQAQSSQTTADSADVTHIAEWFSKAPSGRIALRLVTRTLPNERALDSTQADPQMPFEMDDGSGQTTTTNALPSTRADKFSTLHLFQRQVLTRARKDIKEWCSVEILSILKSTNEITPAIGALVQRLFEDLPAHAITKAKVPLDFVARSQETPVNPLDLFKREFEKGDLLNVLHCNGVYFVIQKKKPDEPSNGADEGKGSSGVAAGFEIPYWAFFELESDHISLCFHHPDRFASPTGAINRLAVLTRLQLGVRAVCRRVNQFLLLLQLHETRTCNGLLLPPNGNLPSSPRSPRRRKEATSFVDAMEMQRGVRSFFWPGQFECDLRYSAFFKLNERLAPNFALNMLCTSALEQFQVHNRRHIFVYRDRDGHVFYMKISIHYETAPALAPTLPVVGGSVIEERHGVSRSSTGGSGVGGSKAAATTTTTAGVPGILLEVFGVSEAGDEVTNELCRLLERKLDEATQVVLMKLLARNSKFQLSQTDLAFLCPPAVQPASMVDYILPGKVVECATLLHYLSQTLKLAPYIRPATNNGSLSRTSRDSTHGTLRGMRRGSLSLAPPVNGPEESIKASEQEKTEKQSQEKNKSDVAVQNGAQLHPACFGEYVKAVASSQGGEERAAVYDAAVLSPVYFSTVALPIFTPPLAEGAVNSTAADVLASGAGSSSTPASPAPEIVDHASYVLNLNPDLRLSPGFMSRVGKGLALMRVDLLRNCPVEMPKEEEGKNDDTSESSHRVKCMQDIAGLASLYASDTTLESARSSAPVVLRCQVWIRGSINTVELSHVMEAFLEEALYDYHIEATIRKLQASSAPGVHGVDISDDSAADGALQTEVLDLSGIRSKLPSDVDALVELLESACLLPSSSVTKLGLNVSIAPWDLGNAVAQMRNFLCCLPPHLRPAVYAKSNPTGNFEIVENRVEVVSLDSSEWRRRLNSSGLDETPLHYFRMVVKHMDASDGYDNVDSSDSDAETTTSMSSIIHHIEPLMRSNSIHSEISDVDSVSGRLPPTSTPSVVSTSSSMVAAMGGPQSSSHQPYLPKSLAFSESDVLLYPNSSHQKPTADERERPQLLESKRSFYYVVDLSTSDGLRLYGYNMSPTLVDALATHMARVLTWSALRENLLRSLLLEKTGFSTAAPVGSIVRQPRSLFLTIGSTERTGKSVGKSIAALCKDSAVHFIKYWPPALSILQGNDVFPKVLDFSLLRSIEGTALGTYLREAHTQPASEAQELQLQRSRAKSNTSTRASVGPGSIPDLTREASGQSSSQWSAHSSSGDAPSNSMEAQSSTKTKSGGILSGGNSGMLMGMKPDKVTASPTKRLSGGSAALPYPSGNPGATSSRLRGGTGATTALMAARARARGGAFPRRLGAGPGTGASREGSVTATPSGGDNVAPWDLPLSNTKGPRLHVPASGAESKPATVELKARSSSSSSSLVPTEHVKAGKSASSTDPGRINSSWKKRLEHAWGPRFLFPGNTERWAAMPVTIPRRHIQALEEDDDGEDPVSKKNLAPLPFFCAVLEKRWEEFETRSTSHTVSMNLLEKLATLKAGEEMEEPVAKDVVAHLMTSGHLLLHQRFRAAFVERWIAAEMVGSEADGDVSGHLKALQSCMDLVNLLSYKSEFVFDHDECAVAKLYTDHTVLSMGAEAGADVLDLKQQVAANMERLRVEVASEFYQEYAIHLRALGFRRLRTLNQSSRYANAFAGVSAPGSGRGTVPIDGEAPGVEGFSEYFYHSERATAEAGGWHEDPKAGAEESYPLSLVVLEVKCDHRGVRLSAMLVSLHDLEQQDLRFQNRLAAKGGRLPQRASGTSGARVQSVGMWLRAQLQTRALIYGFTIRYFQQHLLQWVRAAQDFHDAKTQHDSDTGDEDDSLVATPHLGWKNAATFQNIVKGLQCFLHAFPDPPEDAKLASATTVARPAAVRSAGAETTTAAGQKDAPTSSSAAVTTSPGSVGHRTTPRAVRYARRLAAAKQQHQAALQQPKPVAATPTTVPKPTATPSLPWHDCLVRMTTVSLQPTSLQSNCFESILVQILLRYIACHGSRYEVLDLLQFGTPDAVVCHSSSGSFFHRPPAALTLRNAAATSSVGYSLVITTQPLTRKPLGKDCIQLVLLKSTPSARGVGNGVLSLERALEEAQLFVRELFRVAAQHYERDLLWARLLFDDTRGPGADVARTLALPPDLFRVEVGPQQLEECLRLSICTPLEALDPRLDELLRVTDVCWQELALRLRDIYIGQLREFQFQEEDESSSHLMLLCPDTFDLIIHLTFVTPKDVDMPSELRAASYASGESGSGHGDPGSSGSASRNGSGRSSVSGEFSDAGAFASDGPADLRVEICRREEPPNKQFTFAQRRAISEFVNSIVHWQWRSLIYD